MIYSKKVLETLVERGYTINKEGVVRNPKGKIVNGTLHDNRRGYYCKRGGIRIDSKVYKYKFHRFQGYIKYGDKIFAEGVMVCHYDDNPLNNHWDNLILGTNSDNQKDRWRNYNKIK